MKKQVILSGIVLLLMLSILPLTLATNLEISSNPIQSSVIADTNEPAIYKLTIENLGESDQFEIYSLVGVDITPTSFRLETGETKTISIEIMPQSSLLSKKELPLKNRNNKKKFRKHKKDNKYKNRERLTVLFIHYLQYTPDKYPKSRAN
jgi:hypothetical protein